MIEYLRNKIGYVEDGKNYGMCVSVLNKCQDLTYTGKNNNKSFDFDNDVIKQYLQRTMIQIKAQQDTVLAEYADSCISDVASCLSQNNYNYSGLSSSTSGTTYSDAAINACMSIIKTCKSATTPDDQASTVKDWLNKALNLNTVKSVAINGQTYNITRTEAWDISGNPAILETSQRVLAGDNAYAKLGDNLLVSKNASTINVSKNFADTLTESQLTAAGFTKTCGTTTCQLVSSSN